MPIEIIQVTPSKPVAAASSKPAAPPLSATARKQPHPTKGVAGMNWFMRTQYPNPSMQRARETLADIPAIKMSNGSIHPVPYTHPLNGVYSNVARKMAPSFRWNDGAATTFVHGRSNARDIPFASFRLDDIPGIIDTQANMPGYMKNRAAEIERNVQNKSLPQPRTMRVSIPNMMRLFQDDAPAINVYATPYDIKFKPKNADTAFFHGTSNDRKDPGYIRVADTKPSSQSVVLSSYGPGRPFYRVLNSNSPYISSSGFDRAGAVLTPWGRFGHKTLHELNHATSQPSWLQYLSLTPNTEIEEALAQYGTDGTGLFWNDQELDQEAPIRPYSLDLAEQVGAQQSFQRENHAIKQLLRTNPESFKHLNADTLKALQALPTTVNDPDEFPKLVDFYKKNTTLLWEGARYIDQLNQKENRVKALKYRIQKYPNSPGQEEWRKQLQLIEEDLNENKLRAPFIGTRRVTPAMQQPVYKTAASTKRKVDNMYKKASVIPQYVTNLSDPDVQRILMREAVLGHALPSAGLGAILGNAAGTIYNIYKPSPYPPSVTTSVFGALGGLGLGGLIGGLYGRSVGKRAIKQYQEALAKSKSGKPEDALIAVGTPISHAVAVKSGLERPDEDQKDSNTVISKAASTVYREKLADKTQMADAIVGNARKRKQQKRSMNGFLKRQEETQQPIQKAAAMLPAVRSVSALIKNTAPMIKRLGARTAQGAKAVAQDAVNTAQSTARDVKRLIPAAAATAGVAAAGKALLDKYNQHAAETTQQQDLVKKLPSLVKDLQAARAQAPNTADPNSSVTAGLAGLAGGAGLGIGGTMLYNWYQQKKKKEQEEKEKEQAVAR